MISRVAECCYWLHRYVERAESTARLLTVNQDAVLEAAVNDAERWRPIVIVMGEQERFESAFSIDAYSHDVKVEEYLVWDESNPASIRSSLYWARENARTIREAISREMWEVLNSAWQWMNGPAKREYRQDRARFYQRVRSVCNEFYGLCFNTLSHSEAFDFMQLGTHHERLNQTARIMDVKHHWWHPDHQEEVEPPEAAAQWLILLRFCSAMEPFYKRHLSMPSRVSVASFLLQERVFPRSILHCCVTAKYYLERAESMAGRTSPSQSLRVFEGLSRYLERTPIEKILVSGLHRELTSIIEKAATAGELLHSEFFDPELPSAKAVG